MASPQIDNGKFTRISNEILERLCQCNLNGRQARACFYVLRMTYGFQQKQAEISSAELAEQLGTDPRNARKTLLELCDLGILVKTLAHRGVKPAIYSFNKDWEKWSYGRTGSLPELIASRVKYNPTSSGVSGQKQPDKHTQNNPTNVSKTTRLMYQKQPDYVEKDTDQSECVETRRKKKEERRNNPPTPQGAGGVEDVSSELRSRVKSAMLANGWKPSPKELTRATDLVSSQTPCGWDKSAWRKHVFRALMVLCEQVKAEIQGGSHIYAPIAVACERLRNQMQIDAMLPPKAS